ncbi:MAG: DUF4864 domain-containing protein [Waddliaceae bacterium]
MKKMPAWFTVLLGLVFLGIVIGGVRLFFADSMQDVIEEQLSALREDKITKAYYEYTSKDFQETTSLADFRKFIDVYPILVDNKKFVLNERDFVNGQGNVKGVLISEDFDEMNVEYRLVKEDKQWKILNLRLKESAKKNGIDSGTQALVDKIEAQLKTINAEDLESAYYGFSSKDFQQQTSFEAFREFVKSHPVLTNYNEVNHKDSRIENSQGFVNLVLDSDKGDYLLEYKLVREDGSWKIWSLRVILPPEEAAKKTITNPEALVLPVQEFLNTMLKGDLQDAYNNTAKEFQEVTSYDAFEDFVGSYAVLTRHDSVDITKGFVENGSGTVHVTLNDDEGETTIEFQLGFGDGEWKIWGMKMVEKADIPPEESSAFPVEQADYQALEEELVVLQKPTIERLYDPYPEIAVYL